MENEFIPYKEALEINKLGFDNPCIFISNGNKSEFCNQERYYSFGGWTSKSIEGTGYILIPSFKQVFNFFRERYELDSQILYDGFKSSGKLIKCYSYDIIKGYSNEGELTNRQDKFSDVLNFAHQDIQGKYLNDEKFEQCLFEKYGYKTYEDAELYCVKELINIVKLN